MNATLLNKTSKATTLYKIWVVVRSCIAHRREAVFSSLIFGKIVGEWVILWKENWWHKHRYSQFELSKSVMYKNILIYCLWRYSIWHIARIPICHILVMLTYWWLLFQMTASYPWLWTQWTSVRLVWVFPGI